MTMKKSMKFVLLPALLLASASVQAVTCGNGFLPSNPDSIYTDHNDGTVTDTRTGLMWKKCAEGLSGANCATSSEQTYTWSDALALAGSSTFAGYSDWRLPNIRELRSLVEECRRDPAINDAMFPNTPSSYFWSGSPRASTPDFALSVYFIDGVASSSGRGNALLVRLVRGGQSFDSFADGDAFAPNPLTPFTDVSVPENTFGQSLDAEHQTISGTITSVTGIRISASDGLGGAEYRIQKAGQTTWSPWTSAPGAVGVGDKVQVRLLAGAAGTTRTATLEVAHEGGTPLSTTFSVTVTATATQAAAAAIPSLNQWGALLLTGLLGLISLAAMRRRKGR